MNVKIFVLGRPGSGKSTAARHLHRHFTRCSWSTVHINDYDILKQMFLEDIQQKRFRATANNGFDAIDFSVFDIALHEVERKVEEQSSRTQVVTIEFARDDYRHALRQFSAGFLEDANFLFLDADIDTCLHRVHERVLRSISSDDHPSFSDDIFRRYYARDSRSYIAFQLQQELQTKGLIEIIDNGGSLNSFLERVTRFVNAVLGREIAEPLAV